MKFSSCGQDAPTTPFLWGDIAAITTLDALPVIALAFALQRYLVRGLSFGTIRE
jgi:ABC-type glycerol-3-phosphate transport system permease component